MLIKPTNIEPSARPSSVADRYGLAIRCPAQADCKYSLTQLQTNGQYTTVYGPSSPQQDENGWYYAQSFSQLKAGPISLKVVAMKDGKQMESDPLNLTIPYVKPPTPTPVPTPVPTLRARKGVYYGGEWQGINNLPTVAAELGVQLYRVWMQCRISEDPRVPNCGFQQCLKIAQQVQQLHPSARIIGCFQDGAAWSGVDSPLAVLNWFNRALPYVKGWMQFEIGNEIDLSWYFKRAAGTTADDIRKNTVASYLNNYLYPAASAIRASKAGDIYMASSNGDLTWTAEMLFQGSSMCDYVAFHPYESTVNGHVKRVENFKALAASYGKKTSLTEDGLHPPAGTSDADWSAALAAVYAQDFGLVDEVCHFRLDYSANNKTMANPEALLALGTGINRRQPFYDMYKAAQ